MPMHRLTSITMGVPNVRETAEYYLDFGLLPTKDEVFSAYSGELLTDASEYRFGTVDGGEQLRLVHSPRRRLLQLGVGVEDPDDLGRIAAELERLDLPVKRDETSVTSEDPGTEVRVVVEIAPKYEQTPTPGRRPTRRVPPTGSTSGPPECCGRTRSTPASSGTS
jgi:hypothetical protein